MKDKKVIVAVSMSPDERDAIHELARQRGYAITSDYLRALIIADAKAHNFDIQFDVDRGGDRIQRD